VSFDAAGLDWPTEFVGGTSGRIPIWPDVREPEPDSELDTQQPLDLVTFVEMFVLPHCRWHVEEVSGLPPLPHAAHFRMPFA